MIGQQQVILYSKPRILKCCFRYLNQQNYLRLQAVDARIHLLGPHILPVDPWLL